MPSGSHVCLVAAVLDNAGSSPFPLSQKVILDVTVSEIWVQQWEGWKSRNSLRELSKGREEWGSGVGNTIYIAVSSGF